MCSRSTAWLTTGAITTSALPDSRKKHMQSHDKKYLDCYMLAQGNGKNMIE